MLNPGGSSASEVAGLWWWLFWLGVAVFAIVVVGLAVAIRRTGDDTDADEAVADDGSDHGPTWRHWVLGGGVILPSVVIAGVLVLTLVSMRALADRPPSTLTIEVVGHQFWWEVRYPEHGVVITDEIHIPAGQTVTLEMWSADVIHSLWVPALAGKIDLLPERVNILPIDAKEPGRYDGRCAEFCGLLHAHMDLVVVAHEPGDFATWLEEQAD